MWIGSPDSPSTMMSGCPVFFGAVHSSCRRRVSSVAFSGSVRSSLRLTGVFSNHQFDLVITDPRRVAEDGIRLTRQRFIGSVPNVHRPNPINAMDALKQTRIERPGPRATQQRSLSSQHVCPEPQAVVALIVNVGQQSPRPASNGFQASVHMVRRSRPIHQKTRSLQDDLYGESEQVDSHGAPARHEQLDAFPDRSSLANARS